MTPKEKLSCFIFEQKYERFALQNDLHRYFQLMFKQRYSDVISMPEFKNIKLENIHPKYLFDPTKSELMTKFIYNITRLDVFDLFIQINITRHLLSFEEDAKLKKQIKEIYLNMDELSELAKILENIEETRVQKMQIPYKYFHYFFDERKKYIYVREKFVNNIIPVEPRRAMFLYFNKSYTSEMFKALVEYTIKLQNKKST
jgi:hypothetical protein